MYYLLGMQCLPLSFNFFPNGIFVDHIIIMEVKARYVRSKYPKTYLPVRFLMYELSMCFCSDSAAENSTKNISFEVAEIWITQPASSSTRYAVIH